MSNPWFYWGLGPSVAGFLGFSITTLFAEWAITQPWSKRYLIVYSEGGDRLKDLAESRAKISWKIQMQRTLRVELSNIVAGTIALRYLFPYV